MPRQVASQIDNNFIKGLITETTALRFPEDAVTESDNVEFDETGKVRRRLGFDYESNYVSTSDTALDSDAVAEFLWTSVANEGSLTFLVQQLGNTLHFFDVSSSLDVTANKKTFTVNLDTYKATSTAKCAEEHACSFTVGFGDLVVANPACDVFSVTYDTTLDTLTVTTQDLQVRDFEGLTDGLTINERVTSTASALATNNPAHYYNIINQGWHTGDSLAQWDAAETTMPANSDYIGNSRGGTTDSYDTTVRDANDGLNTFSPKGHFILSAFNLDRSAALTADGFDALTPASSEDQLGIGVLTAFGDHTDSGGIAVGFDDSVSTSYVNCASALDIGNSTTYLGATYAIPKNISKVIIYGSTDRGYIQGTSPAGTGTVTTKLYGKQGVVPTAHDDGTLLANVTFNATVLDESGGRTLTSSDQVTEYDHMWVSISDNNPSNSSHWFSEIQPFTIVNNLGGTLDTESTTERPSVVEMFSSRIFYSGMNGAGFADKIYFSKILQSRADFPICYQINDPTAENLNDLLADDGGVIRIPEVGTITGLFGMQASMIVLATNGVWIINGGQDGIFTAANLEIRKLSSKGSNSRLSIVDVNNIPVWWGADGIYTVQFNPDFNSFSVETLTETTIRTAFLAIPSLNRNYAKGAYDLFNNKIVWLYNDATSLTATDYHRYNRTLTFNNASKAFYFDTIQDSVPDVRGIVWASDTLGNLDATMKYSTTYTIDATNQGITFGEFKNSSYTDWQTYATDIGVAADEIDYISYFITGYKLHGEAQRKFQPNYVFTYFDNETNASAFLQGIFDFTNVKTSGRWSTKQQVYPTTEATAKDVRMSRRKIRGNGIALQLRYESLSGKPFTLLGWSILETVNQQL